MQASRFEFTSARGGSGKTRLLVEAMHALKKRWKLGFLRSGGDYAKLEAFKRRDLLSGGAPILIVIDYAENRTEEIEAVIEGLLSIQEASPRRKARVVLVARSSGEWLDEVGWNSANSVGEYLSYNKPEIISAFDSLFIGDIEQRSRLYLKTIEVFRECLGTPSRERMDVPNLSNEAFGRPLIIQIKALTVLMPEPADSPASATGDMTEQDKLLEALLRIEGKVWGRNEQVAPFELWRDAFILLTLVGSIQIDSVSELLARPAETYQLTKDEFERFVQMLCEISQGTSDRIVGLSPDIFGEFLVAQYAKVSHLEALDSGIISREAVRNSIEVICRINSADSRHGYNVRTRALQLLVNFICKSAAKRSFLYAYAAHAITRRPRIISLLFEAGLQPAELMAFILNAGEFTDLACLLHEVKGDAQTLVRTLLSTQKINELVRRTFQHAVTKRPVFPRVSNDAPAAITTIWRGVDVRVLIDGFEGTANEGTYVDLIGALSRLPTKYSDVVYASLSSSATAAMHQNTIDAPQSAKWLVDGLLSEHNRIFKASALRSLIGNDRLADLILKKGGLGLVGKYWRSDDAGQTLKDILVKHMDSLSEAQWELLLSRSTVFDVARFIDGPIGHIDKQLQAMLNIQIRQRAQELLCAATIKVREQRQSG